MISKRGKWTVYSVMLVFLAVTGMLAYSATSIPFRDGLARAFEGKSDAFVQYQKFSSTFDAGESDLFILVENIDLRRASDVEVISDYILEAALLDGITGVASIFSFDLGDEPVFSEVPENEQIMADRIDRLRASQPAVDRFMNLREKTALIIFAADEEMINGPARHEFLQTLSEFGEQTGEGNRIRFTVTGNPAIADAVLGLLFEEFLFLNIFGVVAGTLVATAAFRNWRMGLLVANAAGFALIWAFGLVALLSFELNIVTIVLPTLVMALSFADGTHLGLEIRRRIIGGGEKPILSSIGEIFPAGALAAVTTATAFAVLLLAPSHLLQQMGIAGLICTLVAALVVFISLPLLISVFVALFGPELLFNHGADRQLELLSFNRLVVFALKRSTIITVTGIALLGVTLFYHLQLPRDYSLYEGLAKDSPQLLAIRKIEETLTPTAVLHFSHPVHPVSELMEARDMLSSAVSPQPVYSILDFVDPSDEQALSDLPDELKNRYVSTDGAVAVFSTPHVYDGSHGVLQRIQDIHEKLPESAVDNGQHTANGFIVMTAHVSSQVLQVFGLCFAIAATVSGLLLMIWLGNPIVGLISVVPNLLPITLFGAGLYLFGGALNYTISVALTISFGIAVDDTVHLLNRLRNEVHSNKRSYFTVEDVEVATRHAAPAMTITTLVLSIGVCGAFLSNMPSVVQYGQLVIVTFIMALFFDLLLLPAMLATATRILPGRMLKLRTL